MAYDIRNTGQGTGQAHKFGRVKPVNWDAKLPLFITGSQTTLKQ